jgi:hypothetical protein
MLARYLHFALLTACALFFAAAAAIFAPFTADDAFIVARYAINARDLGDWAFNAGEPISALTSPLHGLLLRGLAYFPAEPLTLYKGAALVFVTAASIFCVVSYGVRRREAPLLAALLVAPAVVLWTFAGLETPLLAALVTAMASVFTSEKMGHERGLAIIAVLGGLVVMTRYDAVLFAAPVVLHAWLRSRRWDVRAVAVVLAAAGPLVWFFYSWRHFGTILPTSFYIKTPTGAVDVLLTNARYMAEHLAIGGFAAALAWVALRLLGNNHVRTAVVAEIRERWGLHAAIAAVVAYGATMATVHMMFAFRHFVPYFGAAALAICHVARRAESVSDASGPRRFRWAEPAAAFLILLVHAFHADALYHRSLQGLGMLGEYESQGTEGYARDYIPAMRRNASDVRAHWSHANKGRPPRIWTFAAGALPYEYGEAYIYEELVSFRYNCPARDPHERPDSRPWRAHADYIHAFTRHGRLTRLLAPVRARDLELISEQSLHFNGRDEKLLVFYNARPMAHLLPSHIGDPCLAAPERSE